MPSKPMVISSPQPVQPPVPPQIKRLAPKPQISLNIPAAHLPQHPKMAPSTASVTGSPFTFRPPNTAGSGTPLPPGWSGSPYANPFSMMYPTKNSFGAGQFMFKQFEGFKDFTFASAKEGLNIGEKSAFYIYEKFSKWSRLWFTHCFLFLVILLYSVAGAYLFMAIEGPPFKAAVDDIRSLKSNFSARLHQLAQDKHLQNDLEEWQGAVDRELQPFIVSMTSMFKSGYFDEDQSQKQPKWSFWNAMFYCGTIYTTIGYGHMVAVTKTGQAVTMAYAVIGIPMFLILLADFGKLFTRSIKFLWAYVRRLYYTGSLRKVRKQAQVQDVLRGMNIAYEIATFRRPSMMMREAPNLSGDEQPDVETGAESPVTPVPTEIEIDDEFNLPISLAFFLLITYILIGAAAYSLWEDWSFFESCYFVFISMSTIGFGDFVPQHPIFMMASILYLVFGLALTSMCINVVQLKLSDSFKQASAKISATIGLTLAEAEAEEEAARQSMNASPSTADGAPALVHKKPMLKANSLDVPEQSDYPLIVVNQTKHSPTEQSALLATDQQVNETKEITPPPVLPPKRVLINEADQTTETKPKKKGFFSRK